jgi:hypothetical protein
MTGRGVNQESASGRIMTSASWRELVPSGQTMTPMNQRKKGSQGRIMSGTRERRETGHDRCNRPMRPKKDRSSLVSLSHHDSMQRACVDGSCQAGGRQEFQARTRHERRCQKRRSASWTHHDRRACGCVCLARTRHDSRERAWEALPWTHHVSFLRSKKSFFSEVGGFPLLLAPLGGMYACTSL